MSPAQPTGYYHQSSRLLWPSKLTSPSLRSLQVRPLFLPHAFTAGTLHDPATRTWNMDTGASSHLNNSVNSLSENFNTCMYPSISVGDGHSIPVTNMGHSILPTPTKSLHLNNVFITPNIVNNLIYVRQFVRDNNCTVEFDVFGFFVKDFLTRRVLLVCDSTRDLYPVTAPSHIPRAFLVSQDTWHPHIGHPKSKVLRRLVSSNFISYNKKKPPVLCHACQLGKHVRLSFVCSSTVISSCFDIIHSDVWTSPILSFSASFKSLSQQIIRSLHQEFAMTDLGPFKYFLGILVTRDSPRLFLSQNKYAIEILHMENMDNCNPSMADGTLSRYKARLIANGSTYLAASRHWLIHQLDVKNAFLHGDLSETVYMHQPPEFLDLFIMIITGDLYPITAPSHIPHAFLVSQHTWHPRLGTQMVGKHVRLSFVSFSTVISCCFDIIHSDVWTSPIMSLSANGSTQLEGVDVDETFSLVVKPSTIRTVFSLAASRHWAIHHLGVKNAFLHASFESLLQQIIRSLHQEFAMTDLGPLNYFLGISVTRDSSRHVTDTAYLLLYVDDIVFTASFESLLQQIIRSLHQEFAMTDLSPLNYFPGISVTRGSSRLFLSHKKYAIEILDMAHMDSGTPIDTESKLGSDGDSVSDPTLYRSLAGSLQYLTFTRPDISYAVQQVCLHMHDPREPHFSALKRILRYIRGTLDYGFQLFLSSTTDLVAYSNADWAGCPTTRRSTSGYCVFFFGNNLLSWSYKRQPTLFRSSAEAEYRVVVNAVAETCWLRNLLRELHTPLSSAMIVCCDNISVVYLSCNPVQHQHT
uniref:Ribonuclease H-like domain-containing protein n=1 Tax=Tanacetum cinerariifolium TaxID=118510 RepID=A0A6L2N861_TANCI|nr:ribonuclease H-like domain-containing protein [Tanacetum cinerariifolium]